MFEEAYKVRPVLNEGHLLHLYRYIRANPVIHGIVDHVADWSYSNCLEQASERRGTLVDREFVAAHFADAVAYRAFVAAHRLPPDLDYLKEW